jgi:hypothetical protein
MTRRTVFVLLVLAIFPVLNAQAEVNNVDPIEGYDCAGTMNTSDCFSYDDPYTTGSFGTKDVKTCTKTACWFCDWQPRQNRSLCGQTRSEAKCYCNDTGLTCEKDGGTSGWCKIS